MPANHVLNSALAPILDQARSDKQLGAAFASNPLLESLLRPTRSKLLTSSKEAFTDAVHEQLLAKQAQAEADFQCAAASSVPEVALARTAAAMNNYKAALEVSKYEQEVEGMRTVARGHKAFMAMQLKGSQDVQTLLRATAEMKRFQKQAGVASSDSEGERCRRRKRSKSSKASKSRKDRKSGGTRRPRSRKGGRGRSPSPSDSPSSSDVDSSDGDASSSSDSEGEQVYTRGCGHCGSSKHQWKECSKLASLKPADRKKRVEQLELRFQHRR
ncbi:hypothetical protein HYH02_011449 [Chlamydomonas schloesseri]|uniref:Uncharacterized protein n=1 Tax=Chlamydomonas schloesseri TaxID=2026947 RepID=A0A835T1B7_9CHLO|nr:hypothetical protein HYH02_011449 [Chlamydomonas schloesseri]|eukprot:KAG2437018.1 hypothetical protein HYH02_011449 [Chlamydomonas schloesseri]